MRWTCMEMYINIVHTSTAEIVLTSNRKQLSFSISKGKFVEGRVSSIVVEMENRLDEVLLYNIGLSM